MTLPNLISFARLLSVPLIVWLIVKGWIATALWVCLVAGLSDALDGFLAKRLASRSTLGVYLDPIADKVLLLGVFLTLGYQGLMPSWLVILVVFRDLLIVGGAILTHTFNLYPTPIDPIRLGKLNTLLQIVLVVEVLARVGYDLPSLWLDVALVYAVAATTIASGAGYVLRWARGVRQIEKTAG